MLDLARRFGVDVYEVEGLKVDAVYSPETAAAFIKAGLDPVALARAADWILNEALREATSLDRP